MVSKTTCTIACLKSIRKNGMFIMKITGVSFIYSFHFYRATNYELLERWNRKQKPRWSSRERGFRFPRKELPRNRSPLQRYGCPRKFSSTRAHPRRRKYVERMSRSKTMQQLFSLLFHQRISFRSLRAIPLNII